MNVFHLLFIGLWLVLMVRVVSKRFGPVKNVKAEVIGKQTVESFSKYVASGKNVKYVVIFSAGGKKLSFYVSQFSYGGYRKGEKGTLTYRGDRLIDFQ